MATHARQQYFADESSLSKEKREFSIADEIQEKIDSVEEGAQVNKIETVKVNGTALVPDANKAVNVDVPEIIDNLYTVDANDALSAKQGKILYDYIQNLLTIGRFLSNWDSATGLPVTNPSESPYTYKAGDYYRVSNVATSPATNYKPNGSSYTIGVASTTVETSAVAVSDMYLYDGTDWILLSNSGSSIAIDSSLSTTSTNPVENRVITNALNGKHPGEISNVAPSNPVEGMLWYDTVNDELKTYNGTAWQTEGTKMVVLEYGVSTWQDFIDAYNENAIVYCRVSSGSSGYRMAFMAYTAGQGTPTEVEFQYYRSRSSHSQSSTQLDEVYVYKLTNAGVWTTTQRDTGAEMIAGTGIGITFNSSGATINNTGVTSVNGSTGAVTVSEFDATNGGVKVFTFPSANDDITDLVTWLTSGGDAILKDSNSYCRVTMNDTLNREIRAVEEAGSSRDERVIEYDSSKIVTSILATERKYFAPDNAGSIGDVLTKKIGGYEWSEPSGGDTIEYVTQAEYTALLPGAESDGKHYFIYSTSGGGGWQPGANTIAYWKFDDSLDDEMGNYNGTNNGATITYSALPGDNSVKYANVSATGNYGVNLSSSIWLERGTQQTSFTFAGFFKMASVSSGFNRYTEASGNWAVTEFGYGEWDGQQSIRLCTGNGGWQENKYPSTLNDDTWYSLVRTYDHTTRTKSYYVNGTLLGSATASLDYVTSSRPAKAILARGYNGGISNCVFETNTVWTAQDVSNFHDTFKSLYGIS